MAPEQARGEIRRIGPASDVYALGAILYEALTGGPPFKGEGRVQTVELVKTHAPEPPSRLRSGLARDLEAICMKCLEKEPDHRYASAGALAEDLERWLRSEPTLARQAGRLARLASWVRRHRRAGAVACLLLLPFVLAAVLFRSRDPDRPLEGLERQLSRGKTVTLIGDKGDPVWYQWGNLPGVIAPSRFGEGSFSIAALEPTVLTLLPDPQGSYRFRAEVRHEDTTRLGEVGIAFLYSQNASSQGPQHCFGTLTFNDHEALHPDPLDGHLSSRVCFLLHRVLADGRDHTADHPGLKYFTPARLETPGQFPWRSLAVEVRSEGIDLFWEGEWLGHFPTQQIHEEFAKGNQERRGNRMVTAFPELRPSFSPRDALGLFVFHGRASFRHVLVEPLP